MATTTTTSPTLVVQAPPTGLLGRDQEKMLAFLSNWWISIGTIASLLLQILLLLTGGTRKWNRACRFVAWSSYNMSDFMATLVLGGLAQTAANSGKTIYAVWAPMLLLHLGAPDNISAYALEDAELWQRHGFTMLLQIISAAYVVANCATSWRYTLVSLCLLAAGSIKSAERTLALRCASKTALEKSALPIFEYMRLEPWLGRKPVLGDPADQSTCTASRAYAMEDQELATTSQSTAAAAATKSTKTSVFHGNCRYDYILMGEDSWYQKFQSLSNDGPEDKDDIPCREAARRTPQFVTLQDVLCSRDLAQTPCVVLMCVGFSLFKLYRRRLTSLYMYEWRHIPKTLLFYLGNRIFQSAEDILFVLDVELRFLFDSLYTKASGTAFTELGVIFRIGTTILLVVSGIFLISPAMKLREQAELVKEAPSITFLLLAAALFVEAYQLTRIALSDWTKVWLAYTYIKLTDQMKRRPNDWLRGWAANGVLEMIRMGDSIARHKYWNNRIGQYSMRGDVHVHVHTSVSAIFCPRSLLDLRPQYEYDPRTIDDFKRYVLLKVLHSCKTWPNPPIVMTASKPYIQQLCNRMPDQHKICAQYAIGDGYTDIEHILVNWHVATCICELLDFTPDGQLIDNGKNALRFTRNGQHLVMSSGKDVADEVDYDEGHPNRPRISDRYSYPGVGRSNIPNGPYVGPKPGHVDHTPISTENHNANYATEEDELEQEEQYGGTRLPRVSQMGKLLSRYMAYLLVHKTELLPCHAYTAKRLAMATQRALRGVVPWDRANVLQLLVQVGHGDEEESDDEVRMEEQVGEDQRCYNGVPLHRLHNGLQAARHLQKIENVEERWRLIMELWVEILIFAAAANKASEQLQQLTLGGEFLTNIWVLLGHMGAGEK